jgi:hypothetical protein
MRKNQLLTNFRRALAIAAMAAGLLAGASLPAAAQASLARQPSRAAQEHVQMHRDFKYEAFQPGLTFEPGVSPDYCDLPSAGCESYLSN